MESAKNKRRFFIAVIEGYRSHVNLCNSHTPRHCGLDPQSPLYIVVSGNLVNNDER